MSLEDLIATVGAQIAPVLRTIGWAEDEIHAAQARYPHAAGQLWHSFTVLQPTGPLPWTEPVYRAHCRELLDRVAHGHDTRPGTAAECCLVLSRVSLQVPLPGHAAALYARMWRLAGLPPDVSGAGDAHAALYGADIAVLERDMRRRLRQNWRQAPASAPASPDAGPAADPTP